MDIQELKTESTGSDFSIGQLVKYERFQKGDVPQTWKRTVGVGVIVSQSIEQSHLTTMKNYTVWSDGESFECAGVFHITSPEVVIDINNDEERK